MKIRNIHDWGKTYKEAESLQRTLRERLVLEDGFLPEKLNTIAGADVSYSRGSNLFFASAIVLDFPEMKIIEESFFSQSVDFPYIPGLLSFREAPPLLKAFERLSRTPDLVIFDGQGIAHPRGIGLAAHLGLFLDIPTIGCAKTRLTGTYTEVGKKVGSFSELVHENEVIGAVLRTKTGVKPVFVSQGHKIGLKSAVEAVLSSCRGYRLPEPTRQAHLAVNRMRLSSGTP